MIGPEEHISRTVQDPGRKGKVGRGCVEGMFEGVDLNLNGRLASNLLVHASGGKPDPFSKDEAQVGGAVNFVEGAFEQGDLTFPVLSTDGPQPIPACRCCTRGG